MIQNQCNNSSVKQSSNGLSSNLDYDAFFNSGSKKIQPSPLRALSEIFENLPAGKLNVSLGRPHSATFPFQNINICLKDGSSLILTGETLDTALQYGSSYGMSDLLGWLRQFQDKMHGPISWKNNNLIVCTGCQEGLSLVVSTFLEPNDVILLQIPAYPGILSASSTMNIEMIPLYTDFEGVQIDPLEELLEERYKSGKTMPKFIVLNPTGGNPTGVTICEEERIRIYQLACKYNFLIIEDDPYYFLRFSENNLKSFLSMDSESRVIRLDSFSKIVSSGLRLGFITGPTKILEKMVLHINSASVHPSSLSQTIILELLKKWQFEGFVQHLREVMKFYKKRRDRMVQAVEMHLKGLVDYTIPSAGLFLWLRLKFIRDSMNFSEKKCLKKLILIAPGIFFHTDDKKMSPYFRMSYSSLTDDEMDSVTSILATLIREELSNEN